MTGHHVHDWKVVEHIWTAGDGMRLTVVCLRCRCWAEVALDRLPQFEDSRSRDRPG